MCRGGAGQAGITSGRKVETGEVKKRSSPKRLSSGNLKKEKEQEDRGGGHQTRRGR